MLRILDNMNGLVRFDVEASTALLAGGKTGSFVIKSGDTADLGAAGDPAVFQVWTESYRDETAGKWSPDVEATGNVTLVYGKYRALTNAFAGTPAVGDYLGVNAAGDLAVLAAAPAGDEIADTGRAVAVCTKASHTHDHLDKDWTVIEIATL